MAMMNTEIVYLGRDNTIDLRLKVDGVNADLSVATRVRLILESGETEIDSQTTPSAFDWTSGEGVLKLILGAAGVEAGSYQASLVIYDLTNTNGIYWGDEEIPINVKST